MIKALLSQVVRVEILILFSYYVTNKHDSKIHDACIEYILSCV